jgi:hypothetical protein
MAAMTRPRDARRRGGTFQSDPVKAGEIIYRGAAVCLDENREAVNARAEFSLVTRGIARDTIDNTLGGKRIETDEGIFDMFNAPADPVTQLDVLGVCYWLDNQTVCKSGNQKSIAGVIKSIDEKTGMVSVQVGRPWPDMPGGGPSVELS